MTGRADASAPGGWRRDPFPGNRIPANRINPIAKRILSYQPKSNRSDPVAGYARSNLFLTPPATDAFFNYVFKIDQQFNEKHRMYVRFAQNDRTEDRNTNGIFSGPGQDGQQPFKRINDAFVADHLATFSPAFIFNFRVSFNRFIEDGFGAGNLGFDKTTLGFPASLVSTLPGSKTFGRYTFDNYNTLGRFRGNNLTNTIATHPSFTWTRGSQTWRGGVDMRWTQYITKNEGSPFLLTGTRGFTQARFDQGDANSGDSIASFLLGYVGGQVDYNLFPTTLGKYYAPWFQNDWKVNRRLTLNLGLRWDVNVAPNERYNRLNRSLEPNVTNPANALIDRTQFPNLPQLKGGLLFAGVNDIERIAGDIDWNNIQPRIGFAYLLREKLVMRGGWGLYFVNPTNAYLQHNGFQVTSNVINSLDGGRTPIEGVLSNPFPNGITIPAGAAGGAATFLGRGFSFVNPSFQIPYVHQFSFGFQYQMPWESKLEVSYVGNRTLKLQTDRGFNEPDLAFRQRCNPLEGGNPVFCNEGLPNPFRGLAPFAGTNHFTATTLSRFNLARPYPHFGGITEVTRNDGRIDYNSLQVTFEKRARSGLNVVSTYTFSRQIEEWGWNDLQKNIKQRGLYLADRPHRFTTGMVYQLPFGDGKKLFNVKNGILSKIVSGWESNLILQWQSGRPWDLSDNVMWINPDAYLKDIQWKGSDQVWAFRTYPDRANPAVRSVCAARVLDNGTLQMQTFSQNLEGCSLANVDMIRRPNFAPRFTSFRSSTLRLHSPPIADLSFNKNTKINERMSFQFRVEMFNFTNTYSYYVQQFTNNPDDRNFGSLFPRNAGNTAAAYPRHIQLAGKFIF